jgi:putative transposase
VEDGIDMKAYRFKLKTNKAFAEKAMATLSICCEIYNAGLQERKEAWRMSQISVNYHSQAIQLPKIKVLREDVDTVYSQVLQDVLRRLSKTFDAFYRRVERGEKPGYPRFKSKYRFNSFTYPQSGFRLEGDKLHLSKIGSCRIRLSRSVEGTIKTCTVKHQVDGWYVIFAVEENQSRFLPKLGNSVGIDVGIESFATLSTGEQIENPRFLRQTERELKTAQRRVSRRTNKKSSRRRRAVKSLAKKHQKVARQRLDFFHKVSLNILREFDDIAIEDLNIKRMVKNHRLGKSISDAAWGTFASVLEDKAESAGRRVVRVPAAYTSQECSQCGQHLRKSLAVREHKCGCGFVTHRDHNAALNILGRADRSRMGDGSRVNRESPTKRENAL